MNVATQISGNIRPGNKALISIAGFHQHAIGCRLSAV